MDLASANEAAAMWSGNSMTAFSIYLTVTFAYLAVSYLTGKDLSRFQVVCISTLYVAGAVMSLASCITHLAHFGSVVRQYEELASVGPLQPEFWTYYVAPLLAIGIVVSLYFMWDVRRPKED